MLPFAAGGEATVENIELRCRAHNAYEAELYYGPTRPMSGEGIVRESTIRYWPSGALNSFRNELSGLRSTALNDAAGVIGRWVLADIEAARPLSPSRCTR